MTVSDAGKAVASAISIEAWHANTSSSSELRHRGYTDFYLISNGRESGLSEA